jgi:hypothetical protein
MLEGVPASLTALVLVVVAVVPGACFVWGFEETRKRRVGDINFEGDRRPPGERMVLFVVATVTYHLLVGWPEYLLWREHLSGADSFTPGRFALVWGALAAALVIPALAGLAVGSLWPHALRGDPWRQALTAVGPCYMRVRLPEGDIVAGRFGIESWAGLGPTRDLYLEEAFEVRQDGSLGSGLGFPLFIPGEQVRAVDFVPAETDGTDGGDE